MSLYLKRFKKDDLMILFLAAGEKLTGEFIFEIHGLVRKHQLNEYTARLQKNRANDILTLNTTGFDSKFEACLLYLCRRDHHKIALKLFAQLSGRNEEDCLHYIEVLINDELYEKRSKWMSFISKAREIFLVLALLFLQFWYCLKLYDVRSIYANVPSLPDFGFFSRIVFWIFQYVLTDTHAVTSSIRWVLLVVIINKAFQLLMSIACVIMSNNSFRLFRTRLEIDLSVVFGLLVLGECIFIWQSLPVNGFWSGVKLLLLLEVPSIAFYNVFIDS